MEGLLFPDTYQVSNADNEAQVVLKMATLNAARALGLEKSIGSLVPGKLADMVAIDLTAIELLPCYDPLSHIVYVADRKNVTHVWVHGELLVENGRLTRVHDAELRAKSAHWAEKVRIRD